ncbi:AhpC/TSA family protein [Mucilaginibacter roseus]|uniref:AhpC/TSA family protein n=1 Tax=Mucilaginibacter roseus TaxID=1528868 RepID=A0ABS8U1Z8_9SPHI|nr:TlpA disulfide reductase family protein [Mucilaginibacter roseus]MCD8739553.1 AhpC/TSA family protein [Mucilaginibacter roseus]
MKFRLAKYTLLAGSLFIFACNSKDSSSFTVTGELKNPVDAKQVQLLQMDSTELRPVDSATIQDGKFELKGVSPYAAFYRLKIGENEYDLIAKNGEEITFKSGSTKSGYEIKGSDESEKLKEFHQKTNVFSERNTKLSEEFEAKSQALGKQSDSLLNIYRPEFLKNLAEYNKAAMAFANDNKSSLAGFYAATSVDPRTYEQQLIAYAEDIKDKFKDNPIIQRFVTQMIAIKPVSVGQKAQDFTIPGIDGKSISLADYKGKYLMIDFWASWCVPCRQENPNVVKQYNLYKSKGLNILGISLDDDKAKWQAAIKADGLAWAHASNLKGFEGPVERMYQITAIPSNFIIDPQGVIVAKNITGPQLKEFLKKTFSKPQ